VDRLRTQLVDRLDRGARGLDHETQPAEQLGELAERFDVGVRHEGAKPASHELHYIGGKPLRNG
jgi:hypothetical protein